MQDAKIHYGLTLSDSSAELVIDERKANSHQSKAVIKPESSQAIAIQPSLPPTTSNAQPPPTMVNGKCVQVFWKMII